MPLELKEIKNYLKNLKRKEVAGSSWKILEQLNSLTLKKALKFQI